MITLHFNPNTFNYYIEQDIQSIIRSIYNTLLANGELPLEQFGDLLVDKVTVKQIHLRYTTTHSLSMAQSTLNLCPIEPVLEEDDLFQYRIIINLPPQ